MSQITLLEKGGESPGVHALSNSAKAGLLMERGCKQEVRAQAENLKAEEPGLREWCYQSLM